MNPYQIVNEFEQTIADYTGAKYGVAVESCTAALLLSCVYCKVELVVIPRCTYPSVPMSVLHAGGLVQFTREYDEFDTWQGEYALLPYSIWDSALRFKRGMYHGGFQCLSFHLKKHLPIGRGGMILTDDKDAYEWFKRARFDGRDEVPLTAQDDITVLGYNMYCTPEQAIRGLQLFALIKDKDLPDLSVESQGYPDLSKFSVFQQK